MEINFLRKIITAAGLATTFDAEIFAIKFADKL